MEMSEGMKAFAQKYGRSLNDPKLRGLYALDLSARRDWAEIVFTAEERGEARGEAKAHTATVQNMLNKKFPVDVIYDCVDAPRAEIDAIIAKLRASSRA